MSVIQLSLSSSKTPEGLDFQYLHSRIQTPTGNLAPHHVPLLKDLTLPDSIHWQQGIVLEGKIPIWLCSYLLHQCRQAPWIACYDPRLGGVVVSSQALSIPVGTVLPLHPSL